MQPIRHRQRFLRFGLASFFLGSGLVMVAHAQNPSAPENARVKVVFQGGYDTNPVDRGRPVNLVAGALGVSPEVFREAFRSVKPAPGGRDPDPAQVRRNKAVLMQALAPHGVTNDRLDEVSNYYRIRPGERWPVKAAEVFALIRDGEVTGFEIVSGGSGYHSPPTITVPGYAVPAVSVTLGWNARFDRNGAISSIDIKPNLK